MAITLKRNLIYQALFVLSLTVPYLNNYELTFFIWCLAVFVSLQRNYSVPFIKYAFCFTLIAILAFFAIDFENAGLYFILRDITYLLKPVIGLFLGYQLCKYNYKKAFETFMYTGFGVAVLHLTILVSAVFIHRAFTVNDLRFYGGYFSDFEVYALIMVLFHQKFQVSLSKKRFYLLVSVIGFSSFMYLARTNFIQFFILLMALKGYFVLNKRAIIAIASVVLITVISYSAILYINPKRDGAGLEAFLYKIKVAPTEPFKRKINEDDYKDFNDNYRSVELNLTLKQVANKGIMAVFFGEGLGSQVDLKREVFLGDMNLRYISVLHNSFMTVFLKSGILGILILVYSIYLLYNQQKSGIPINNQINLLLMGTAVFLLVSNWVLMGYYFTADSKSILVGFLLAYKEITRKNHVIE